MRYEREKKDGPDSEGRNEINEKEKGTELEGSVLRICHPWFFTPPSSQGLHWKLAKWQAGLDT